MLIPNLVQNGQKQSATKKVRDANPLLVSEESVGGIPGIPGFILAKVKADGCWRHFVGFWGILSLCDSHHEIIDILAKPADEAILRPLGSSIDRDTPEGPEMLSETQQRLFGESAI
jgi:hypothetical protein